MIAFFLASKELRHCRKQQNLTEGAPFNQTPPAALESHYRSLLWLVPTVVRFPRSQKFLLGERIQSTALDVLERLIEATYTRQRDRHLAGANLGLEKLRSLCRLAREAPRPSLIEK